MLDLSMNDESGPIANQVLGQKWKFIKTSRAHLPARVMCRSFLSDNEQMSSPTLNLWHAK